jgi:hypothetical protein
VLSVPEVESTLYASGPSATFAPTTSTERATVERLIPQLLAGARAGARPDPQWRTDAARAGFAFAVWRVDGDVYWALVEAHGKQRGAGAYLFHVGGRDAGAPILLEAPHEFFDEGTGGLAAELFFHPPAGPRPRALFTNTMDRYHLAPDVTQRRESPADVAHNPAHAFSYATAAFARAAGGARVIQLHGFADRDSALAVISAGDPDRSSPLTSAIAAALARELGDGVKRFPEDVAMLGATTNAQVAALRAIPGASFVHLEMAKSLRDRLATDGALLRRLGAALFATEAQ